MTRKTLSGEGLIALVHEDFGNIKDHRRINSVEIPLKDALMSAFAVFSLKFPSLFKFEEEMATANGALNLKALYGIEHVPSDTQMRSILDEIDPETIRPVYSHIFSELQRGKALEPFWFYQGHYLIAVDGTGYFESKDVHCESCQVKVHHNGELGYSHHMLGMVMVH